uniref:Uncharacterized protein n=1 Tax=Anguilla anguilla TaxID=7936 RepID=A0A0E9ULV9_ANGAN
MILGSDHTLPPPVVMLSAFMGTCQIFITSERYACLCFIINYYTF